MHRRFARSWLLTACLVLILVGEGPAGASVWLPSGARAAAPPAARTTLRLQAQGCDRCTFYLQVARSGSGRVWTSPTKQAKDGVVVFRVATSRTRNMSIVVGAGADGLNAVTNVVFRYSHEPVGSTVSAEDAEHKARAAGCWAGTSRRSELLRIRVVRFHVEDDAGTDVLATRAWLRHTHAWLPPMVTTYDGNIGNQDAFYCG